MEWTISYCEEHRIVVYQTSGVADVKGSREMADGIAKTMMHYKAKRCLIDYSHLNSVAGKSDEIYSRPVELREIGVRPDIKIAVVVLPAHKSHFSFLEAVLRNRNIEYMTFIDQEAALQWLTE
jgi:hypothetical protein